MIMIIMMLIVMAVEWQAGSDSGIGKDNAKSAIPCYPVFKCDLMSKVN